MLIAVLVRDGHLPQHQARLDRQGTKYLGGFAVFELIETGPQCLTVHGNRGDPLSLTVEFRRMLAKGLLDCGWIQNLQRVANRGIRRCPSPMQSTQCVQSLPVGVNEMLNFSL